jgi:hypothetical protein
MWYSGVLYEVWQMVTSVSHKYGASIFCLKKNGGGSIFLQNTSNYLPDYIV